MRKPESGVVLLECPDCSHILHFVSRDILSLSSTCCPKCGTCMDRAASIKKSEIYSYAQELEKYD